MTLLRRSLLALTAFCLPAFAAPKHTTPRAPVPHRPLLVGYLGQWSANDGIFISELVHNGGAARLDQIDYSQGSVVGGHCALADPHNDLQLPFTAANSVDNQPDSPTSTLRGNFHQLLLLKRRYPHLRVLISLEGQAKDFAADAQPAARPAFVASCVDTFLRGHFSPALSPTEQREAATLFDGIDVDWEYPQGPDAGNFLALLTELRASMNAVRPGLLLTVAMGPSPHMYPGADLPALARIVDQVGLMNYDYNGPWSTTTGLLAPLYSDRGGSVEHTIQAYQDAGIPPAELLMGLPFYGYGWHAVPTADGHGLFQQGKSIRDDRPYRFFAPLVAAALPEQPLPIPAKAVLHAPASSTTPNPLIPTGNAAQAPLTPAPFRIYRDPRSQAPWLYDGDTFYTYEDPTSARYKANFVLNHHLAGMMIWELGEDSADGALLRATRSRLDQPPAPEPQRPATQSTAPTPAITNSPAR